MPKRIQDDDRGLKVFHSEKRREKWIAFVIRNIASLVGDAAGFKQGLDALLRNDKQRPSERHNHAIFAVGPYSLQLQGQISSYILSKGIPAHAVEKKDGTYFTLHRNTILSELDAEISQDRQ
ncbi:MAG: hypothetical protein QXM31_04335 [Candidatus Woesearchaeota archaeon]